MFTTIQNQAVIVSEFDVMRVHFTCAIENDVQASLEVGEVVSQTVEVEPILNVASVYFTKHPACPGGMWKPGSNMCGKEVVSYNCSVRELPPDGMCPVSITPVGIDPLCVALCKDSNRRPQHKW